MSATAPDPEAGSAWPGPTGSSPAPLPPEEAEPAPTEVAARTDQESSPPEPAAAATAPPVPEVQRTRTGTVYVASIVGIVVTALVIVFIVQNLHEAKVHFVNLTFSLPVGVIILGGAVAGALIVVLVSLARIIQLRMAARRHRRAHRQPA